MNPFASNIVQCLKVFNFQHFRDWDDIDVDSCNVHTTGGNFCGIIHCKRPVRSIFVSGLLGKTAMKIRIHNPLSCTVRDLKLCIKLMTNILPEHQCLVFGDREMDKLHAFLREFGVEDNSTVVLVVRPSSSNDVPSLASHSSPKEYSGEEIGIKLTTKPDCITGDRKKNVLRGVMSCGHAADPNSLFEYATSRVCQGKTKVICPAFVSNGVERVACNTEWKYREIRKMAKLTALEKTAFEIALGHNVAANILKAKECPQCHALVQRASHSINKTECAFCDAKSQKKYEEDNFQFGLQKLGIWAPKPFLFCWHCNQAWKNTLNTDELHCGNTNCTWDPIIVLNKTF